MLQRPGFFAYVVFGLLISAMVCANALNTMPHVDEAQAAEGQAAAPTASASDVSTAPPDVLATTDAAGVATSQAARAWQTDTQVVRAEGTRVAETQTPASWTAVAVGIRSTADAAAADKAKAEAVLAWGTVTAAVATETERPRKEQTAAAIAEENRIATAIAIATADEARRQAEARAKYYGDMAAEGWGKLQVAIPYLLIAFFAIMALLGAGAVLNRIEAPTWPFRAKAKVIVDAGPSPASAPKVDAAETIARTVNRRRRDLVRDDQRARLIGFVEAAIRIAGSGEGNVFPSQSDFRAAGFDSVDWWDTSVGDLVDLGLARTSRGNGGGTFAAGDLNLNGVADILRRGSEE